MEVCRIRCAWLPHCGSITSNAVSTNSRTMCSMSVLPVKPWSDEQNRPDDEQHERHDAQQLVQFGALLQERREELFKGGHTSGRFEVAVTELGTRWARSSGGTSARISAPPR